MADQNAIRLTISLIWTIFSIFLINFSSIVNILTFLSTFVYHIATEFLFTTFAYLIFHKFSHFLLFRIKVIFWILKPTLKNTKNCNKLKNGWIIKSFLYFRDCSNIKIYFKHTKCINSISCSKTFSLKIR